MNKIPQNGERVVYTGKNSYISQSFNGYNVLEIDKVYTVDESYRISHHKPVDDNNNWCITLLGIKDYGYHLDSFETLQYVRIQKLDELLY